MDYWMDRHNSAEPERFLASEEHSSLEERIFLFASNLIDMNVDIE